MPWLLESGCYDQRGVVGVYSSLERAMAAWAPRREVSAHPNRGSEYGTLAGTPWSYQWVIDEYGGWRFDADWEDHATITEIEIDEED